MNIIVPAKDKGTIIHVGTHAYASAYIRGITYENGMNVFVKFIDGTYANVEFSSSEKAKEAYQKAVERWATYG